LFLAAVICLVPSAPVLASDPGGGNPDARSVLVRHYEAIGGVERLRAERHRYLEGEVELDGMRGRYRQWESPPLRFRREEDYGIITQAEGDNGVYRWSRDTNGKIQVERDPESLKRRQLQALLQVFDHLDPASPRFRFEWMGIEHVDGEACHVLRMSNFLNEDVETLFISTRSFLLLRSILRQPDVEMHTRYDDFRPAAGLIRPFREETQILPRDKRQRARLSRLQVTTAHHESLFEPPAHDTRDWRFLPGEDHVTIPFALSDHRIVLNVTLLGDTQPWLLDSAASMSVIDAGYAADHGLGIAGQLKGFGFGHTFDLAFVTVPGFRVAGIAFDKQTLFAFHGLRRTGDATPIAGILGWDFLSRLVTRIDFAARRIAFYDPRSFDYRGPGTILDAPLKNRAFTIPATLWKSEQSRWTLDLGAFDTAFHAPFAIRHRLLEREGIDRLSADLGGVFREKTIRVCDLAIGAYRLPPLLVNVPYQAGKGAHADGELAGNLGYSLLRRFVVYLDYARQQVILEKGSDFDQPVAEDRSGLQVDRSANGDPLVVLVAPQSPASRAGLLPDDLILKLDGSPLDPMTGVEQFRLRLGDPAGSELHLDVKRGEQLLALPLRLETLFPECREGE